jgi:hypothetical protein
VRVGSRPDSSSERCRMPSGDEDDGRSLRRRRPPSALSEAGAGNHGERGSVFFLLDCTQLAHPKPMGPVDATDALYERGFGTSRGKSDSRLRGG